jgi:hypothetical protein
MVPLRRKAFVTNVTIKGQLETSATGGAHRLRGAFGDELIYQLQPSKG